MVKVQMGIPVATIYMVFHFSGFIHTGKFKSPGLNVDNILCKECGLKINIVITVK